MPVRPPVHRVPWHKGEKQKRKEHDAKRGNSAKRGYGRKWRKAREDYLKQHPCCVVCEQAGIVEPSTVVDHIKPHKGDLKLFWSTTNWQALCKPCHDRKTMQEGSFGNEQ